MCFYNLHMEVACVSTIYIFKLYVFLQFTHGSCMFLQLTYGSCMCFYIDIRKLYVFLQFTYGSYMCFHNWHKEVACVSTIYIWKLYVFPEFTYGSCMCL